MKTNNDTRTDEQLWTEVLEVLHDNRRELTDEEVKMLVKEDSPSPTHQSSFIILHSSFRKIAAIFLAAAFLGGLAWAIIPHFISPKTDSSLSAQVSAPSLQGRAGGESVRFSDIRLDSILTVVSAHYEQQVKFLDEAPRELRFTITWNSEDSLATFIMTLNEFDGLRLCNKQDTIFVESVEAKEEEE